MELSILDCPICYEPLTAPIFQCGIGHVLCSTCNVLLIECPQCSGTVFQRCFIMERVVESVVAPCSFTKHGCVKEITRFNKKKHEMVCLHRPCFCPDPACSFTGTTAPLLVHFTTHHKWPSNEFKYHKPFFIPVKPGPCLLHAQDGQLLIEGKVSCSEPLSIPSWCMMKLTMSWRIEDDEDADDSSDDG